MKAGEARLSRFTTNYKLNSFKINKSIIAAPHCLQYDPVYLFVKK